MPVAVALALLGALLGLFADRLAARWPEHEDAAVRGVDWRTVVVVVAGGAGFGALALRWPEASALATLGPYFAALVVLMAIDLDQRLLPDLITLPMIPVSLALLVLGLNPLLQGKELGLASGLAAGIAAPVFLIASSAVLRGGVGVGDIKLAVSLGFMSGLTRLMSGFIIASVLSSLFIIALLATRRLKLRSAIPFGPILICGAAIGALIQ
ncbi:MAG: prepilin peptidase [Chloroflexi bacterium]|nr:prepilin peptidase [Chloroflexota bacterium]